MRVISKSTLQEFWESPGNGDAREPLEAWYTVVKNWNTAWWSWADLKAMYPSADIVGDCVVFDIANNRYRLIARLRYEKQRIYVLKIMTHKEYDKNTWKEQCGCYDQPQKKAAAKPRSEIAEFVKTERQRRGAKKSRGSAASRVKSA